MKTLHKTLIAVVPMATAFFISGCITPQKTVTSVTPLHHELPAKGNGETFCIVHNERMAVAAVPNYSGEELSAGLRKYGWKRVYSVEKADYLVSARLHYNDSVNVSAFPRAQYYVTNPQSPDNPAKRYTYEVSITRRFSNTQKGVTSVAQDPYRWQAVCYTSQDDKNLDYAYVKESIMDAFFKHFPGREGKTVVVDLLNNPHTRIIYPAVPGKDPFITVNNPTVRKNNVTEIRIGEAPPPAGSGKTFAFVSRKNLRPEIVNDAEINRPIAKVLENYGWSMTDSIDKADYLVETDLSAYPLRFRFNEIYDRMTEFKAANPNMPEGTGAVALFDLNIQDRSGQEGKTYAWTFVSYLGDIRDRSVYAVLDAVQSVFTEKGLQYPAVVMNQK